jgi:hypothetical protein
MSILIRHAIGWAMILPIMEGIRQTVNMEIDLERIPSPLQQVKGVASLFLWLGLAVINLGAR